MAIGGHDRFANFAEKCKTEFLESVKKRINEFINHHGKFHEYCERRLANNELTGKSENNKYFLSTECSLSDNSVCH